MGFINRPSSVIFLQLVSPLPSSQPIYQLITAGSASLQPHLSPHYFHQFYHYHYQHGQTLYFSSCHRSGCRFSTCFLQRVLSTVKSFYQLQSHYKSLTFGKPRRELSPPPQATAVPTQTSTSSGFPHAPYMRSVIFIYL